MTSPAYHDGEPLKISLGTMVKFSKMLHDVGHADEFIKHSDANGGHVLVDAKTINLAKKYLFDNNLHQQHEIASSVVGECPPDCGPYQCCHIHRG